MVFINDQELLCGTNALINAFYLHLTLKFTLTKLEMGISYVYFVV